MSLRKAEGSTPAEPRMEPFSSPVVATGGNQPQLDATRKPEGVSGSSPEEGLCKSPAGGVFIDVDTR